MLEREVSNGAHVDVCPTCGANLAKDGNLLVCARHGAFFTYSPHLLVRVPGETPAPPEVPMPWENGERAATR